jgi:hypothetical protein
VPLPSGTVWGVDPGQVSLWQNSEMGQWWSEYAGGLRR